MAFGASLLFAGAVLTGCGQKTQSADEQEMAEHDHDAMSDDSAHHEGMNAGDSTELAYYCPMHPEITGKKEDKCSKCGMALVRR